MNIQLGIMQPSLRLAANGYLTLEFGDYDSQLWKSVCSYLETELGFQRSGQTVAGFDEGIRQSFVRADLSIAAGWDNWAGDYLLANSADGDDLLRAVLAKFSPNSTFDPGAQPRRST